MRFFLRPGTLPVLVGLFAVCGCGSNNKGAIEGKWKVLSASRNPAVLERMAGRQLFFTYTFSDDGTLAIGTESSGLTPLRQPGPDGEPRSFSLKYKLKSGNDVEAFDVSKTLRDAYDGVFGFADNEVWRVSISGTEMAITEPDGNTVKLLKFQ
jgi:hypothetical protein